MGLTGKSHCQVNGCDRSWSRHPVLEISCPTCKADVGGICKRPSGHQATSRFGRYHAQRYYDALDEGHFGECPIDRCPESSAQSKERQRKESNDQEEKTDATTQKKLPV